MVTSLCDCYWQISWAVCLLSCLEAWLFSVCPKWSAHFMVTQLASKAGKLGKSLPCLLASSLKRSLNELTRSGLEGDLLLSVHRCSPAKTKAAALSFLPILTWLPSYPVREYLFSDVVSGLSTGMVQLPQGQWPAFLSCVSWDRWSVGESQKRIKQIKKPQFFLIKLYMKMH